MRYKTILITGNDLVGKTTLIGNLVPYLKDCGYNVDINSNDLFKTDLKEIITSLLEGDLSNLDLLHINSLFFVSYLIDSIKFQPDPKKVIVQDSYVCRTNAFCQANGLTPLVDLFQEFKDSFYSFDVTIQLKASIPCRIQRLKSRGTSNKQDQYIFTDHEMVVKLDHYLDNIVKTHKNYFQLDTTELSINEVFDQVVKFLIDSNEQSISSRING